MQYDQRITYFFLVLDCAIKIKRKVVAIISALWLNFAPNFNTIIYGIGYHFQDFTK
jgi:hypothetical protein